MLKIEWEIIVMNELNIKLNVSFTISRTKYFILGIYEGEELVMESS